MEITKAVITAAGRGQRTLPLQTLIERDNETLAIPNRVFLDEVVKQ